MQDAAAIKEKILITIRQRGPSLPVHIASATGQSMLFASAFLAELLSEKRIKISSLRVGSSPLYFLEGQENQLENFSKYLKNKDRESYELLRERKFLKDKDLQPAIRVAIRSIKDFAIPMEYNNDIYWKYFSTDSKEFIPKSTEKIEERNEKIEEKIENIKEEIVKEIIDEKRDLNEKTEERKTEIKSQRKQKSKKKVIKQDDKFLNKVKEYLTSQSIEIIGIEGMNKNELMLRIKADNKELLLGAFNKKRISESEIIKTHKKAREIGLTYTIFGMGDPQKRLTNFIESIKSLESIRKIE